MPVRVQLPDLEHWKAQVKCQAGCPVATDAGRYVQLIAEGRDEEAFLVARAPNPFASVCGRVCAAPCEDACRRGSDRRAHLDPRAEALRHRAVRRRVAPARHPGPACASSSILEGNRYPRPPARSRPLSGRRRGPTRRKVAVIGAGPAGPLRRPRPRAPRLRRHGLRGRRRAGRDDALRHPRVPPAAHAHPRGDREDPRPRRDPALGRRRSPRRFGLAELRARRLRGRLPLRRRLEGPRPAGARASSSTAS